MSMNSQGRQTTPEAVDDIAAGVGMLGGRGLLQDEPMLFDAGREDATGTDWPEIEIEDDVLGSLTRDSIGLKGLTEPETVRHYVRLSQYNYAIDLGLYPLGSCTMKHNPRLNEKMARLPGFADIHPLQPVSTVQGALGLIDELAHWLKTLTGMPAVAMSPKAGAHGELCGMLAIRAAHEAAGEGEKRKIVLVPSSAHGTNPATAAQIGYQVVEIKASEDGRVDFEDLKAKLSDEVAALMLTNPNTCGLFERDIMAISEALHAVGAYFYCDGANFNALAGRVRPGDLGVDAMHINLHKTFSTPHGGGGPGAGPVVLSAPLAPFAPVPWVVKTDDGFDVVEHVGEDGNQSFGRLCAFHGQMGMYVRALSYMLSHGADGVKQASEDAVLNANYILARLQDVMTVSYPGGPCMHEALFDERFLAGTGVSTLDFAKAMIDEGYHPMTMYFPLVVKGAMLIEPTESESKDSLDAFADTLRGLVEKAKAGEVERFKAAPVAAPMRRLDETQAARQPKLRWRSSMANDTSAKTEA